MWYSMCITTWIMKMKDKKKITWYVSDCYVMMWWDATDICNIWLKIQYIVALQNDNLECVYSSFNCIKYYLLLRILQCLMNVYLYLNHNYQLDSFNKRNGNKINMHRDVKWVYFLTLFELGRWNPGVLTQTSRRIYI